MSAKVHILGRIATVPEYRPVNDTGGFVSFRIATNRSYTKKDGTRESDFFSVSKWVSPDSKLREYLERGKQVYIEGSLENDNYEKEDGTKIFRDVIKVQDIMLTGSRGSTTPTTEATAEAEASPNGGDGLPF